MKKLTSYIVLTICLLTGVQAAQKTYIVKIGDVLSRIAKKTYPDEKIYGANGSLNKVIKYNPHLKTPHLIYPMQEIFLDDLKDDSLEETSQISESKIENEMVTRSVSETHNVEGWNLSALYGVKYLSVSQSGSLGNVDIGVLLLEDLKFNSEFSFEKWSFGFQFDSYKFKYKTVTEGDSEQIHSLNLYGAYDQFMGGLAAEQEPLFRTSNNRIELTKVTLLSLILGIKKDFDLPTKKTTSINLKAWLSYPLSSSSSNTDVKINSIQGYSFNGQIELNRLIFAKDQYSFHATWLNHANIMRLSQNVDWDTSSGVSDSDFVNISTSIGALIRF
jgi:hypothetical protein